jgi:hypothetical protein
VAERPLVFRLVDPDDSVALARVDEDDAELGVPEPHPRPRALEMDQVANLIVAPVLHLVPPDWLGPCRQGWTLRDVAGTAI